MNTFEFHTFSSFPRRSVNNRLDIIRPPLQSEGDKLRAREVLTIDFLQTLGTDMGINLCR